jgi:hypothetical protein
MEHIGLQRTNLATSTRQHATLLCWSAAVRGPSLVYNLLALARCPIIAVLSSQLATRHSDMGSLRVRAQRLNRTDMCSRRAAKTAVLSSPHISTILHCPLLAACVHGATTEGAEATGGEGGRSTEGPGVRGLG